MLQGAGAGNDICAPLCTYLAYLECASQLVAAASFAHICPGVWRTNPIIVVPMSD